MQFHIKIKANVKVKFLRQHHVTSNCLLLKALKICLLVLFFRLIGLSLKIRHEIMANIIKLKIGNNKNST